ncbi:MAG: TaqI-like C-terminal specificity domain-containing protein [archaeon]
MEIRRVIEAKASDVRLEEKEGKQAVSYAYHKNIKFAVLTNFKQIRFYHALSNIKNIDKNLLKDDKGYLWLDCENFVKDFDRLWLLSKESFENEEINKLLKNVDKRLIKPIDESILADLLEFRELLSRDLKSKRAYLEDLQIDEVVQILIDRLIFMRSVEDRGLEAKDFLLTIIKEVEQGQTDMNLWAVLKSQFKRFDATYNSKLFSEGILEKEGFFDSKILAKVIRGLYYGTQHQQERYLFDEIPVDLLGSIYEQYLGTIMSGTEKRVKFDLQSGKRKKMGIYYTPSYIVDYIVNNTLGEYCKDKGLDEVLDVKVIDPACGSGSFLIRAFQELINIIEKKLESGEKSKYYKQTFQEFKGRLSLGEKATILTNCIYGVDLDEKAVELAQLNLLLKILEEETRETKVKKLPSLLNNIRNGNSLISDSRYEKSFNWNAQFPEVFTDGGFDIVVGNPPYVNNLGLSSKDKKFYLDNYESAIEQYDLYVLFFEKGVKLLKQEGILGYITPNKYLISKYGKNLRRFFLSKEIMKIVDVSNLDVFKDASTYLVITIIRNLEEGDNKFEVYSDIQKPSDINKSVPNLIISQEKISKNKDFVFEIHAGDEANLLFGKLNENSLPLGEILDVKKGIETGGDKKFIIEPKDLNTLKVNDKKFLVKLIGSRDINKYFISDFGKQLIYNTEKLKGPRNKKIFETEKIVTCRTVKRLSFAYDDENRYLTDTTQILLLKNAEFNLKYVLAIINSSLINYFYRKKFESSHMRGGYFRCFKQYLDQIPIKLPISKSQEQKIVALVEQMLELQKKIHGVGISGNEKEQLEQQIKNVDYEIDDEVYKLYGITDEEKKIIEESLR